MEFKPDPESIRRYPPDRQPYVEFEADGGKVHGRVLGWQADMVLVEYPPTIIDRLTHGQREVLWLHKSLAVRIRQEDSVWATMDDDRAWHQAQDTMIRYTPGPWTVYGQVFPTGQGGWSEAEN